MLHRRRRRKGLPSSSLLCCALQLFALSVTCSFAGRHTPTFGIVKYLGHDVQQLYGTLENNCRTVTNRPEGRQSRKLRAAAHQPTRRRRHVVVPAASPHKRVVALASSGYLSPSSGTSGRSEVSRMVRRLIGAKMWGPRKYIRTLSCVTVK